MITITQLAERLADAVGHKRRAVVADAKLLHEAGLIEALDATGTPDAAAKLLVVLLGGSALIHPALVVKRLFDLPLARL